VENDPVWGAALRCYPSSLAPGTSVASTPDVNTTTSNPSASDIAWWIAGLPVLGPVAYGQCVGRDRVLPSTAGSPTFAACTRV
jgi:hypothetical protein